MYYRVHHVINVRVSLLVISLEAGSAADPVAK